MSDYLWDKTGEPDEEVERLEALLGALAHRPRALALPARVVPPERRGRSRLFAPFGLAAAAALLLAFLVGAAVLLRTRTPTEVKSVAASETQRPREGAPVKTSPRASGPMRSAPVGGAKDETAAVEALKPGPRDEKGAQSASLPRRQKRLAPPPRGGMNDGVVLEAMSAGGGAPSFFESTRLKTKEQLVYALRLTGAKLRDVRQKTRGAEPDFRR